MTTEGALGREDAVIPPPENVPESAANPADTTGPKPRETGWQLPGSAPMPDPDQEFGVADEFAPPDPQTRRSDWESPAPPSDSSPFAPTSSHEATAGPSDWGAPPVAPLTTTADQSKWRPPPATTSAHRPGVVPLRPLSVGEILDGAITYIRRNPLATMGTAAVLTTISGLLQAWLLFATAGRVTDGLAELATNPDSGDLSAATLSLGQSAGLLVGTTVGWLIGILATGMLTVMMGAAIFGKKLDISSAWRAFAPRLLGLFALTILVGLSVAAVVAIGLTAVIFLGALGAAGILGAILLGLVTAATAVWLWVSLVLSPVILVLEKRGPLQSWRRAMVLVRGAWWRIFGIQLLATVIASVIAGVISVPFQFLASSFGAPNGDPNAGFWLLITLGSVVAGVITLPFTAGVTSLLYLDRRMRREAFDLTLRSQLPKPQGRTTEWLSLYQQKTVSPDGEPG
jgi:hypothetical protein